MRNLKRALSLGLTAAMISGLMVMGSSAASYADVTSENNVEAIEVLEAVGIMIGDENGDFNPDQNVTRNEMAVVMSNLMAYNVATYRDTSPFTDVPSWAEPYVAACYTNGITAGTSDTTYGGSESVTTAQAALMVMKALGYFQYASDFGNDWQLSTASQGNRIDLFVDVDSGLKETMTRNDVAQLVLNALEAGTVEADAGSSIIVGGVTITNDVKYNYITSGEKYAESINSNLEATTDATVTSGKIVQLGEKLYQGDLTKKDDYDAFGRPAAVWEYQAAEIGTYAEEADYTFTAKVTPKALYDAIGSTAANYDTWEVSVNGNPVNYDGDDLIADRTNSDDCFLLGAEGSAQTGNGVLTEVYVDGTDRKVDIAVTHYYVAEVLRVNEDDGTITLSDLDNGPARATDLYETTAFDEDQIVVYTYSDKSGDIEDVQPTEFLEGEITRVRVNTENRGDQKDGDSFTVDGKDYKYNYTMSAEDRLLVENVNNGVAAYLDPFGYAIYIDEAAMTYDYAYVLTMNNDKDAYGDWTYYARLVLTDGTMMKVETDNNSDLTGRIVSYSKDKNDVYTLSDRSEYALSAANNLKIENGVASFKADDNHPNFVANSNTVFIVADPETKGGQPDYDNYDFTVYTGIANVPDIDANDSGTQAVVAARSGNIARVVYILDADVSGSGDVIFIRADSNAKLDKDSELGNYYVISAVVDGEVVEWHVKEASRAAEKLVNNINESATTGRVVLAADGFTTDSDGLVTNVSLYGPKDANDDGIISGTKTGKHEQSTIALGNTRYGYNGSDTVVVKYDRWDNFSVERINSIKDDRNDGYVAVLDGNVVMGVCYMEVVGGEGEAAKYDLTINGTGSGDMTNFKIDGAAGKTGADVITEDSVITFTVPADYTVAVTGASVKNTGNDYTVNGILGDVTITITKAASTGAIDSKFTVNVKDSTGVTGFTVTDAHIVTAADDITTATSKYNAMNVGDLYLAFTAPTGVTLTAAPTTVNVQIGGTTYSGVTATGAGTSGTVTVKVNAANIPAAVASASSVTIEIPVTVSAQTYTVNYTGSAIGGTTGISVDAGSGKSTTSLTKGTASDIKLVLNGLASDVSEVEVTATISGVGAAAQTVTKKSDTCTSGTATINSLINASATANVTVEITKIDVTKRTASIDTTAVKDTGFNVTSTDLTGAALTVGATIDLDDVTVGLPTGIKSATINYTLSGVTPAATDGGVVTGSFDVATGSLTADLKQFTVDGDEPVKLTITGATYKTWNGSTVTLSGSTATLDGATYSLSAVSDITLKKDTNGKYVNDGAITLTLTTSNTASTGNVKGVVVITGGANWNGETSATTTTPSASLTVTIPDGAMTFTPGSAVTVRVLAP